MSLTLYPLIARCLMAGSALLPVACSSTKSGSAPALAKAPEAKPSGRAQHGVASIYTDHRTASGEKFSRHALTAAHRTLPMGSKVRVTNLRTEKSVIVRINDRGPFIKGRIIDLTPAAADRIGITKAQGIGRVKVEPL